MHFLCHRIHLVDYQEQGKALETPQIFRMSRELPKFPAILMGQMFLLDFPTKNSIFDEAGQ